MKTGAENRNKTIAAGVLGTGAVLCVVYLITQMFGGPSTPPPSVTPTAQPTRIGGAIQQQNAAARDTGSAAPRSQNGSTPAAGPNLIAGVDAQLLATTSASLDPTLHQDGMLRAEHLAYSGSGRNIFSASYVPPPVADVKPKFDPRPKGPVEPPKTYVPPPTPTCPPSCPPINLKFFGVATYKNGTRQALLLSGDEVLTAFAGEIVARKYKIVSIAPNSLQVQDLVNNNTQTLPLSVN